MLVVLPFDKCLVDTLDVEAWIIGLIDQFLHVVALKTDVLLVCFEFALAIQPALFVLLNLRGCRHADFAHDQVACPPGLCVKHVKCVKLILHAEVHHFRIGSEGDALVQVRYPHAVGGDQSDVIRHERVVVQVPGTQNDGINFLAGAIFEVAGLAVDARKQGFGFPVVRPVEAHRVGAITGSE